MVNQTNEWSSNAAELCGFLLKIPLDDEKPVLNADQSARCMEILKQLSTFLDPLIRITNHPIFRKKELYDDIKKLRIVDRALDTNKIFLGCQKVAIALKKDSEVAEQATIPADEITFQWLKDTNAPQTLGILKEYASRVSGDAHSLKSDEIQRCRTIFKQIEAYIEELKPIFDCEYFEGTEFYKISYALINAYALDELDEKLERLLHARLSEEATKEIPTPGSTPDSKKNQRSQGRISASPKQPALVPLSPSNFETRPLLPKKDTSERDSCCVIC